MMIIRGVNVFPSQIEELILKQSALAPHYQCILSRQGPLDALTVAVETKSGITTDSQAARTAAAALSHDIKTYVGSSATIELRPEGGVERSVGKARRVVDLREKK
jgi:phenylacetate-CoA ligase